MKKGIGVGKNLYHNNGNFYWVKITPKMIFVEWIPHYSGDIELDQNIDYKELKIKKDNNSKHCLKDYSEGDKELLVYPDRAGKPFYLEPATIKHLEKEIESCEGWGLSSQYYKNLRIFAWGN